ncbi:translocation/assembly module TamB domain-containing protein [Legionella drancourtii]|uniref:Translocation and assembly module TamB C-terminal domain-containing protein n=1 Tax=Legionella drancourtii LLAP12 TaxID=658187 RepID=G9EM29_9GAMM|nr:translocation/assembly module TamB domain-containing protein [Legionella drancourtii]EHL31629.1 hypothetical protein LDG_6291 [Legionella drancourtii LLAP12]
MIRFLVKASYIAMLFCILLAGIVVCLLSTTPGLQTVIDLSQHYLPGTLTIQHLKGSLLNDFSLDGIAYQDKSIKIKIKQLNVQWHPNALKNHALSLQWHDLQGALSKEHHLNSSSGTLSATATLPDLALNLNAKLDTSASEHWQIKTSVLGSFPWQWTINANLSQQQNILTPKTGLHTNLSLRGVTKTHNQGTLVLTIHPGYYQVPDNASIPQLQFKGGTINMVLSPEKLTGTGALAIDQNKNLKLDFQLPKFALDTGLNANQRINGELSLKINSLDFLQNINPEINKLKGQLAASLKATGTVDKPQIESKLVLSKTSFYLPKLGLNIDSTDLTVLSKEKHWDATGSIVSAGHNLAIKGTGTLDANYSGDLLLEGKEFPIIKTTEYQINISPQLKLHLTPSVRTISGSILIPNAQIKPQTFSNSISLPDEVVYKKQLEQPPSSPLDSTLDINIEMGENVEISVKGLKGHVDGTLNLKQQPQGAMNAYGELSVRDGTYKAYGQDLAIKQGQLIFTGGPINNPGISLRAAKKINNTSTYTNATQLFDFNSGNLQSVDLGDSITLGVEVTGRLSKPLVQLYSDPAILSQADILSMLVLGRPASQANKAGGQLLLTAISSMNIGGTNSAQLLEQLKQTSGLDFNVQTNTNYNQSTNTVTDSTAFVVGKSLSKRLYLSYNIGLSQTDTNVLTLKYMLNKFFSIQISTSDTSSAIDFLYTSNKKK